MSWAIGPGPGPSPKKRAGRAHGTRAWPTTWVLCPMALSYVLWLCAMSYGPVLCPMALSYVDSLSYVPRLAILGIQEGSLNPDTLILPNSWPRADTGCVGKSWWG